MDLSVYSPLCLPLSGIDQSIVGQAGHIYGECLELMISENFSSLGWGKFSDVGIATELLQTATVPIVENNNCKERMNKDELRPGDEDLLVCTGGSSKGPCKVDTNYPAYP